MTHEIRSAFGPLAAVLLPFGMAVLFRYVFRFFHRRPPNQVVDYLRDVDPADVGHLLDPVPERYLRLNMSKEQFRQEQRHRLRLAFEYIGRLAHNGVIVAEWGQFELKRNRRTLPVEEQETCLELVSAGLQVRMCGFVLRARIKLWLVRMALLPFLAPPSVEKLPDCGSAELLGFYRAMTSSALKLSQAYGNPFHKEMSGALQLSSSS
jgi:hypothetical protein